MQAFFRSVPGILVMTLALVTLASTPSLSGLAAGSILRTTLEAVAALISFLFIPFLFIKSGGGRLSAYGWQWPESPLRTLGEGIVALVLLVALALALATLPEFQSYYALTDSRLDAFFLTIVILPSLYYLAEEFFFRGFLLKSLWERHRVVGLVGASVLFALLHLGKPELEVAYAFVLALILSFLTLRSRSVVPAITIHAASALAVNLWILTSSHLST